MSVEAANSTNSTHPAQEFFDYAEAVPTMSAGTFLALVNGINIIGIENFDSIESVFSMSNGWCYGHMASDSSHPCYNTRNCKAYNNGGLAQKVDEMAYYLSKNSAAMGFVNKNSKVYKAYTNPLSGDGGWLERFNIHHPPKGGDIPDAYSTTANIVEGGNNAANPDSRETCWSHVEWSTSTSATATIYLSKIDQVMSDEPLSRVKEISVNYSGGLTGWTATSNGVSLRDTGKVSFDGRTFDIHNLSWAERKNAVLTFSIAATHSAGINAQDCSNRAVSGACSFHCVSGTSQARVSTSSTAALKIKRAKCATDGHMWQTGADKIVFNTDPVTGNYNGTATVTYDCANDVKHTKTNVERIYVTKDTNEYTDYTFTSSYAFKLTRVNGEWDYYRDANGNVVPESYTKRIFKTPGKTSETISFSSANTAGSLSASAVGTQHWFPNGSLSKETWKDSSCSITALTRQNLIYPGAKSITLHYSYERDLAYLSMILYSPTGEILATNSSTGNTIYLYGLGDSQLNGCYLKVSAKAQTHNVLDNYGWTMGWEPADAVSRISVSGITVGY